MYYAILFFIITATSESGFLANPLAFYTETECLQTLQAIPFPDELEVHGTCVFIDNVQGV